MYGLKSLCVMSFCCFTGFAVPSMAADPPGNSQAAPLHANAAQAVTSRAPADVVSGFGHAVSNGHLSELSGGSSVTENQTVNGTVSNNSASQLVTGSNAITGDAFSGATGLPTVIQNSGNNVLIQNATIVNVQFKP